MTPYDAAMGIVVVAGMVWGAWRGITWQLASLASLVLGYAVAVPLSAQMAPHFPGEPVVARALAMLSAYAGVSATIFLVAWIVRATLRRWKFEAFDRHLGMILGGLEGVFMGLLVTLFVLSLAPQTRTPILTSPSGRLVCGILDAVEPILPGEIRSELAPFWGGPEASVATEAGSTPAPTDGPPPASLRDLARDSESRIGRAIVDAAEKAIDQAGPANGGDVKRR